MVRHSPLPGEFLRFRRLAWNPDLSAREISEEWTRLTFGFDPAVNTAVHKIQLSSWKSYENYTGPLGIANLDQHHWQPLWRQCGSIREKRLGQWRNADTQGVGMDRCVKSGTGFAGQYRAEVAKIYESPASTPDELLVFFHHVPYTYRLHSGTTVIQSLYDSHYDGAETAGNYVRRCEKCGATQWSTGF